MIIRKRATKSDLGKACELWVRGDLLARGFKVTYTDNINGKHDVYARIGKKWYTIQVESAQLGQTGALYSRKVKRTVFSDLLALVHVPTNKIRYVANAARMPLQLRGAAELTILYGGASFQSSSLNRVPVATTTKSGSSSAKSSKSRAKSVAAHSKSNSAGRRPSRLGNSERAA